MAYLQPIWRLPDLVIPDDEATSTPGAKYDSLDSGYDSATSSLVSSTSAMTESATLPCNEMQNILISLLNQLVEMLDSQISLPESVIISFEEACKFAMLVYQSLCEDMRQRLINPTSSYNLMLSYFYRIFVRLQTLIIWCCGKSMLRLISMTALTEAFIKQCTFSVLKLQHPERIFLNFSRQFSQLCGQLDCDNLPKAEIALSSDTETERCESELAGNLHELCFTDLPRKTLPSQTADARARRRLVKRSLQCSAARQRRRHTSYSLSLKRQRTAHPSSLTQPSDSEDTISLISEDTIAFAIDDLR